MPIALTPLKRDAKFEFKILDMVKGCINCEVSKNI